MVLPPSCVRLLSRNFNKMHCFRIPETTAQELGEPETQVGLGCALAGPGTECKSFVYREGDGDDGLDGSAATGTGREVLTATESSKCPT